MVTADKLAEKIKEPENSNDADDDADVPDDVSQRRILPDTADAMVHARHIQSPPAHVRFSSSQESYGAGSRNPRNINRTDNTNSVWSSHDRNSLACVQKNDDKVKLGEAMGMETIEA